ncbi:hypothetical protein Srot_0413 [Segniliparus rotundus DSM 44985]|uniref:Uncharacterized protein n=1 Tax=Segniliparus rotundus (strain ATCC BAA-972 / CDC 1076 / CIP 108378 / DSM 44985 / JCM 13578) TaxID=640132 RepID=D6ZBS3_SEGRD|nr:hypothetical protein [Segniliparus rotundus]ADG96900.1 hypothetical protein Srot_0413 [Segniliparus rotundus DSM 44985]
MAEDDPWAVPHTDLAALRAAENAGRRKIWPWVAVATVFVLGLAVGAAVLAWFAKDSLDELRSTGKLGQVVYLRAHAYAEQGAANNAETADITYTVVRHLANKSQPQTQTFARTVSLPWEPPTQGTAVDLEGSLVEVVLTVKVPQKSNGNLAGPTCSMSLDNDLLDNKTAAGYGNEVTCHWKFSK